MKSLYFFMLRLPGLAFLAVCFIHPLQAAWQTTQFEVFVGKPHLDQTTEGEDEAYLADRLGLGVSQAVIDELEDYLHDLAVALQNDGFADPVAAGSVVPVITGEDGVRRIRVYLLDFLEDFGSDKLGALASKCDDPDWRPSLLLNMGNTYEGDRVTAAGYQNMTHELFHAVQYASNFRRVPAPCRQGKWITEGTADAVGFDYARRLRNISTRSWDKVEGGIPSFSKPWGMRAYYVPLSNRFPTSTEDYATSAFWRDLAELTYAKKNNRQHPQSRLAPFDYSYLASLFASRPAGLGPKHELAWLDDWLKSYEPIMRDLAPVYAQFVASAADQMWRRIPRIEGLSSSQRQSRWLRFLFQDCLEVNLSPSTPSEKHLFQLPFASSRCVEINIQSDKRVYEVVIQETELPKDEQAQLWIGAIGGKMFANADIRTSEQGQADAGKSFAWWRLPVSKSRTNIFTVSNISRSAKDTVNLNPLLHFSLPGWEFNLSENEAPETDSSSEEQPKTSEQVANQRRSMRTTPSRNTAVAAMAGRQKEIPDPGCELARRSRNLCGPRLDIALIYDRGGIPDPALMAGAGGLLAQLGGAAGGIGSSAADDLQAQIQALQSSAAGEVVSISIPLIPYGSTGSFSNALISVSKAADSDRGGTLDSLSPAPDAEGIHAPNGSVTITEYTPEIIRGTFTGELVDQKERYGPNRSLFRVVDNISGSFNIPAPWRGNAAPDVGNEGPLMQGMKSDLIDVLQKLPPDMRRSMIGGPQARQLCKILTTDELNNLGIPGACDGGGGPAFVEGAMCDCNCRNWEYTQALPRCGRECDPKWKSWACGPYLQTGLGELDAETQRYMAKVRQLGVPENVWKPWVMSFKYSSPDIRAELWDELEQHKGEDPYADLPETIAAVEAEQAQRQERLDNADAETGQYRAALEQAGYSQAEMDGLVEVFNISPEAVRKVFWDEVNRKLAEQP